MGQHIEIEQLEVRTLFSVPESLRLVAPIEAASSVRVQPFRRHYVDYAPTAVSAYVLHCTIKRGAYPFARRGTFTVQLSRRGNTYQVVGGPGVADSHGTYRYTKGGFNQGSIRFNDSVLGGGGSEALTFTSAHTGSIVITADQGGYQTGTFTY